MMIIRNEAEHRQALARVDALWSAAPGSPEAEELLALAEAIETYEAEDLRAVLPPARPQAVIAYKLRELGWSQRELGRRLGWSTGRVSEVVNGKRSLTLAMVRDLSEALGVDPKLLVHGPPEVEPSTTWVPLPTSLVRCAVERGLLGHATLESFVATAVTAMLAPAATAITFTGPRVATAPVVVRCGEEAAVTTFASAEPRVAA